MYIGLEIYNCPPARDCTEKMSLSVPKRIKTFCNQPRYKKCSSLFGELVIELDMTVNWVLGDVIKTIANTKTMRK